MTERDIPVPLETLKRIFFLLEEVNSFAHQPLNYDDARIVKLFAEKVSKETADLYYHAVWEVLPKHVQDEITQENQDP